MCPKARWQHAEEEDECPRWAGALFDYVLQIVSAAWDSVRVCAGDSL